MRLDVCVTSIPSKMFLKGYKYKRVFSECIKQFTLNHDCTIDEIPDMRCPQGRPVECNWGAFGWDLANQWMRL